MLDKDPKETEVCFIATAADPYDDKSFVEKDKERLTELGFKIIEIDLKQENENSLTGKLANLEVVFVEGGNTFYLMKYIRESGFDKAIKRFLDNGGIYLGVSAGSYVACPDIFPAQWKHAEHEAILNENKNSVSYPIYALTDSQAILINDRDTRFIGPGEFKKFNQS